MIIEPLMANLPIPTLIIVGYRQKVVSYYRTVDTIYALTA